MKGPSGSIAGSVLRPSKRSSRLPGGRAAPRARRRFVEDLDNLGVERSESVSDAHTSYCGATLAANLPAALAIFSDVVRRPHLPPDQLEAGRQVMLQELRAVEDEPSQKGMI